MSEWSTPESFARAQVLDVYKDRSLLLEQRVPSSTPMRLQPPVDRRRSLGATRAGRPGSRARALLQAAKSGCSWRTEPGEAMATVVSWDTPTIATAPP